MGDLNGVRENAARGATGSGRSADGDADRNGGRLYVVATPIGNLGDLSPRALRVLAAVDWVAAEDTRVSGRLLKRFEITAKLVSYHEGNERSRARELLGRLQGGADIALVTDAGTPCISDPGYRLVAAAAQAGVEIVSVPGPSAALALLSISGLPSDRFSFEGFLPARGAARRRALLRLRSMGGTVVLYESPRRIVGLLEDIARECGDPQVAVGRELTKRHEEVLRGGAADLASVIRDRGARGEFVVAVHLPAAEKQNLDDDRLRRRLRERLGDGASVRDIASELKAEGVSRRRVYALAREIGSSGSPLK